MSILNEIGRIRAVMGFLTEQEEIGGQKMNVNLKSFVETLQFLKLHSNKIDKILMDISDYSNNQIIDFDMMNRGLRKTLLKKGDKKKNVEEYLGKIITSLKYRERSGYGTEPESEDYVIALGVPTPEDRKDWWGRYRKQIRPGMINLFDRSWYNRGLIEPVMGYGSPEEYEDFMENVEDFESDLVKEGDYLFKLWFSIDKDTQARRFKMRQQSPLKYWKYSPNDSKMQDLWDRFTEFKEKLFDKTSTLNHPWVIIDAEDKRVSGLNAIRYVLQNIPYEGKNEAVLDKEYPEVLTVLKPNL